METNTAYYIYDGKFWIKEPTGSDKNSFFHSVFGFRRNENEPYMDKYAKDKRLDWSKFITSFENEPMPSPLRDILRKCLSTNDKYKNVSVEDKDQFAKYAADIAVAEHHVTIEEISILAAFDNLRIVVLTKSGSDSLITIEPKLEILCGRKRDFVNTFRKKREVVVSLGGNIFSKLKIAGDNLTKQYQVNYLIHQWSHNLKLDHANRNKCEQYAIALLNRMKMCINLKNHFADAKLQMTMLAQIFQENNRFDDSPDWEGCKEYLQVDKAEPKLPVHLNLVKLFDMFVEKRRNVFINNENSGESIQTPMDQFEECIVCHRILAIEMVLGKDQCEFFSIAERSCKDTEANLLQIGIMVKVHNEFHFTHETFKAYFVAKSILEELQLQNQRADFQMFLFEEILSCSQFNLIRAFIDSHLETTMDSVPSNIFQNYQSLKCNIDFEKTYLQCSLHLLAEEDCSSIIQFLLKCFNFKGSRGKKINVARVFHTSFDPATWKHIFGNPLNVLRFLVRNGGVNISDRRSYTPLHFAAKNGNLKTVKFLVEQGADVNNDDGYNYTPLHLAAWDGHVDTVKFLVECGAHITTTTKECNFMPKYKNENRMPLHLAVQEGHLNVVRFLVEHGADVAMKHEDGPTALYLAVLKDYTDITKYLVNKGADVSTKHNNGSTLLHLAVSHRNLEIVKLLVDNSADIHITDDSKSTALHLAVEKAELKIVRFLLECGAKVNARDRGGDTPFHSAVLNNDELDFVKCLLEKGADINIANIQGNTPVYLAFRNGYMNTAKFLLDYGADINITNEEGFTMLHFAAKANDLDRVKFLMERGANINVRDGDGPTALHLAIMEGNLDVVRFLVESGADRNIRNKEGCTALHLAITDYEKIGMVNIFVNCSGINIRNHLGETALLLAAQWDYLEIVEVLVHHGADVNIPDNYNATPLYRAMSNDNFDVVKVLLKHGAHANFSEVKGCKTALQFAALKSNLETFKFFMEREPDIDIKGSDGATLLFLAVRGYDLDVVKYLVECSVDVHTIDDRGRSALHLAAKNNRVDIVEFLIQTGLDVTARDKDGRIPFHSAAENGALGTVKFLIQRVEHINITDDDDRTALHLAAFKDRLRVVEFLVEAGVDVNIRDREGCTALHLATLWCPYSKELMSCLESNKRTRKRRLSD